MKPLAILNALALLAAVPAALAAGEQNRAHKEDVRHVESVSAYDSSSVQIVVDTGEGSQLILQMDATTARNLSALIKNNLDQVPTGAP